MLRGKKQKGTQDTQGSFRDETRIPGLVSLCQPLVTNQTGIKIKLDIKKASVVKPT